MPTQRDPEIFEIREQFANDNQERVGEWDLNLWFRLLRIRKTCATGAQRNDIVDLQ